MSCTETSTNGSTENDDEVPPGHTQPTKVWEKTYGGTSADLSDVIQTNDKGFLFVGSSGKREFDGGTAWIKKTDSEGNSEWTKGIHDSNSGINSIIGASNDSYILTGWYTERFDKYGEMDVDVWIFEIDSEGDAHWSTEVSDFDIIETDLFNDFPTSVAQLSNNNTIILVKSYARESLGPGSGVFQTILSIDQSGNISWRKRIKDFVAHNVTNTSDGGFVVSGHRNGIMLSKYDSQGNLEWSNTFSGNFGNQKTMVREAIDNGLMLLTSSESKDVFDRTQRDIQLIKTDAEGDSLWSNTYGVEENERVNTMTSTHDGGFIFGGYFGSQPKDEWIQKISKNGGVQWTYKSDVYVGNKIIHSIKQLPNGSYIVVAKNTYAPRLFLLK